MKNIRNIGFGILFLLISRLFVPAIGQTNVVINEFMASNYASITDADFNDFSDWIELYNPGNYTVDLGGFFLTDDLQNIEKWQFPPNTMLGAGDYLLIWCDNQNIAGLEIHTNFKLSNNGESIGLYNSLLEPVDTVIFDNQVRNVSFGRSTDGSTDWLYFDTSSPDMPNSGTGFITNTQASDVNFSIEPGFYESSITMILTAMDADEIRYTVDGSMPGINAELYSDPIPIETTVTIRARSIQNDVLPGPIKEGSYFIGEETKLPVVSMIMNPEFLWDPDVGIYVDEDIDLRRDWERTGGIEFFNEDQELDFTQEAEFRLFGNTAIYYPQKSLAVFPDGSLDYQLFESRETDVFQSFLLRSSSDDWPYTMLRDALMQSLVMDVLSLDVQAYRPSAFFINGSYFGIHNIREKLNEDYLETYYNVDQDNLDLIFMDIRDTTIEALHGNLDEIMALLDFIHNNDMGEAENYDQVLQMIDMENYVDYLIGNLFYSNTSWHHNVKMWKDNEPGNRWRWLFYDLDRGMAQYYLENFSVIEDLDTTDLFFPHLNENDDFRALLLSRLSGFMNSAFKEERVIHYIDSLKDNIADEIPAHSLRWKDECDPDNHCGIQSFEAWMEDINAMKGYTNEAQIKVREYIEEFYNLDGTVELTIHIENPSMGKVYIDNIEYSANSGSWIYFKDIPVEIVAVPEESYYFLEWTGYSFNDTVSAGMEDHLTLFARFGDPCELPEVISEDMTIGIDCDTYRTQGNLLVQDGATLTIKSGTHILITKKDSLLVEGSLDIMGTGDSPVVLNSVGDESRWGCIYSPDGKIFIDYTHFLNCSAGVIMDGGDLEMRNSTVHFSPFFYSDIINIHYAKTKLVDNVFYGPYDDGKTDVIDCDEIEFGWIEGNAIYGTTDDGIDIGTGSQGITLRNNRIFDCNSMGISIGEQTQALVEWNVVAGCDEAGIQVHTQATAEIDHNTLFNNEVSVRAFHYDDEPESGGHAIITNSILSESVSAVYEVVDNSSITFDYSISDTEYISGNENLNTDPMMIDPGAKDFRLLEESPCIDAGDPSFPLDPDDTRTDMGALYFDHNNALYEKHQQEKIFLFPNPATDYVNCFIDSTERIIEVEMYDQQGQRVIHIRDVQEKSIRIHTELLQHGLYHILVQTDTGKRISSKIVIMKFRESR